MPENWSLIVHGGAKAIAPAMDEPSRKGCVEALKEGAAILKAGGSAVDAVVAAVRALENDPTFNAGYGSVLNSDGEVELDAALMDGATLDVGAVGALRGVRNPIDVAHALLRDSPVLLVGEGARRYASEKGLMLCDPRYHIVSQTAHGVGCDTVGCVAYDSHGNLAAGTSTGGLGGVRPGRIGDSPIPGAGLSAENQVGGTAFSGDGESILRLSLAARLMSYLDYASALEAATQSIKLMTKTGGEAGCIVLDRLGRPGVAHNSPNFAFGYAAADSEPRAFTHQGEFTHDN